MRRLVLATLPLWLASPLHATPALPPPPPLSAEGPPSAPEEVARRSAELRVLAGPTLLRCGGQAPTTADQLDPCARLDAGRQLGASALWRLSGHLALGLAADASWFAWGTSRPDEGEGRGRWTAVAVATRGYLNTPGRWEPYVGYQMGLGWTTLTADRGAIELRREGLVMAGQLGIEAWVSSRLRLGVEGEVRWQATGATELCKDGACLAASLARQPDRALALHATLTVALGDEL